MLFLNTPATLVPESYGTIVMQVIRTGGSTGNIQVAIELVSLTATVGQDVVLTGANVLAFADGDSVKSFGVLIVNDTLFEPDESFIVRIVNATNGASIGRPEQTITIEASDQIAGTITFDLSSPLVFNEGVGTINIRVNRVGGVDGPISVDYRTLDASAVSPADFGAVSGNLSWTNGASETKLISVALVDDTLYELEESFLVALSNVRGGASVAQSTIELFIAPSDQRAGQAVMLARNISIAEDSNLVSIAVLRVGGADGDVAVNVSLTPGTAVLGSDYAMPIELFVNWLNGDSLTKFIVVPILDDSIYEPLPFESFTVSLVTPSGGLTTGTPTNTTVLIFDNDRRPGSIAFVTETLSVAEEAGVARLFIQRLGGRDGVVSVSISTANLDALAGSDFVARSGVVVSFADGEVGPIAFDVTLLDDAVYEPAERFVVSMSNPANGATLGANNTVTVTIGVSD